jgi:iron complex outermembrane receptor protein
MRSLAAIALVMALAPQARAQTTNAPTPPRLSETVVVTATAAPTSIDALGRAVVVLTRDEILQLAVASPFDALRLASGVDVRARGQLAAQADVSIRGATFGQSLVLLDGIRLNDAQSGHHNAEVPLPIAALDRIEIVTGPASAVHGADALGGTITFVSRRDAHQLIDVQAGQFGYAAVQASASDGWLPAAVTATGWVSRSGEFDVPAESGTIRSVDRGLVQGGAGVRVISGAGTAFSLHHQRRAFGANQFYGNSPSKEWTDQTLGSAAWRHLDGSWTIETRVTARNHGDHFRWDIARPGFAENRHRTNAIDGGIVLHRDLGSGRRVSVGAGGGGDRVTSTNLGDHGYARGHGFVEVMTPLGPRATMQTGLRVDRYSSFGTALNPSVAAAVAVTPAVRLRASLTRAFRVPTFTELYYTDPANLGRADLRSETGWAVDTGMELTTGPWLVGVGGFTRWDERVIDWVRADPADLWRSTNVRDVRTRGLELTATGRLSTAFVRLSLTAQRVDAPALTLLSKYVLEYARYSAVVAGAVPVGGGVRLGGHVDRRVRYDGQRYTIVGVRVSRRLGRADLFLSGTNLLNARYTEIPNVVLPGRWLLVGLSLR